LPSHDLCNNIELMMTTRSLSLLLMISALTWPTQTNLIQNFMTFWPLTPSYKSLVFLPIFLSPLTLFGLLYCFFWLAHFQVFCSWLSHLWPSTYQFFYLTLTTVSLSLFHPSSLINPLKTFQKPALKRISQWYLCLSLTCFTALVTELVHLISCSQKYWTCTLRWRSFI
jgi:hypothetical protein